MLNVFNDHMRCTVSIALLAYATMAICSMSFKALRSRVGPGVCCRNEGVDSQKRGTKQQMAKRNI